MGGWSATSQNWHRVRRDRTSAAPRSGGHWAPTDFIALVVAFAIRWELGLAFLALKLWHQASDSPISTFAFARGKWEALVAGAQRLSQGASLPFSLHVGPRSSGNAAFDGWRQTELARIDAEREKLATAERDFTRYRDELLHVKDREDFDRFMNARGGSVQ